MNELKFKGDRNELKGKHKQKYAQLTDDDLMCANLLKQDIRSPHERPYRCCR